MSTSKTNVKYYCTNLHPQFAAPYRMTCGKFLSHNNSVKMWQVEVRYQTVYMLLSTLGQ